MENSILNTNTARVIFGAVVCLMFISIVTTLIFLPIPDENRSAVDILLGSLAATMGMVYSFYFGSSDGSKNKTELMDRTLTKSQEVIADTLPPYDNSSDIEEVEEFIEEVDMNTTPAHVSTRPISKLNTKATTKFVD